MFLLQHNENLQTLLPSDQTQFIRLLVLYLPLTKKNIMFCTLFAIFQANESCVTSTCTSFPFQFPWRRFPRRFSCSFQERCTPSLFLKKDPSIVHAYHTFTHAHLLSKDSPMSEYTGMLGIVSLQHSCPVQSSRYKFRCGQVYSQCCYSS